MLSVGLTFYFIVASTEKKKKKPHDVIKVMLYNFSK